MSSTRLINENNLDDWVRGNARDAQGVIVELIWRLVSASCPRPRERRFPLGDSIEQHGDDGILDVELSYDPFVPAGLSYWEIGTCLDAGDKATSDYNKLTKTTPEPIRMKSTCIFVTPLSGRRDWQCTWKDDAQLAWLTERRGRNEWKDVRIIDGTKIIDWLSYFLPVEMWLANRINGLATEKIETLDQHWAVLRTIGEPPPLASSIFLNGRENACAKLQELFDDEITQLKLVTPFPEQTCHFISAYLDTLESETKIDIVGRCLIISGIDAWNAICTQYNNYILIATPAVDITGNDGPMLLAKARQKGHKIIYGCHPGGSHIRNAIDLPQPSTYQINNGLEEAGYNKEEAYRIAEKKPWQFDVFADDSTRYSIAYRAEKSTQYPISCDCCFAWSLERKQCSRL